MTQVKITGNLAHRIASDCVSGDDGFYVYWPDGSKKGALSACSLRQIATLLDWINEPWQEEIDAYFNSEKERERIIQEIITGYTEDDFE